jgi:hypothetical protein
MTLNQRFFFFLLLPVALLLFLMGLVGFLFAKETMLAQWREGAIVKLQRAAHHIDMRLSAPIELINMFHVTGRERSNAVVQEWIFEQLKDLEGVTEVRIESFDHERQSSLVLSQGPQAERREMISSLRANIAEVTLPQYDARTGDKTVTLISELKDESRQLAGRLKVSLRFDYLMQDIINLGWWQSDLACLVDKSGRYLAHSKAMQGRTRLGETKDPLEVRVLENMQTRASGTLLG